MSYETVDATRVPYNETNDNQVPSFIDLLKDDVNKKSDPSNWNPFLLPEVKLFDSKSDTTGKQKSEVPTHKQTDATTEPPPPQSQIDDPKRQNSDVPTQPQTDAPAKPQPEAPAKPPTDIPAQSQTDSPAKPQTDVQPKGPTSETWGRFGRQYNIDTTGNAVYEVRKGDTYSAVARDVLEKRTGRVLNVQDAADRNEILRFSRELADLNGVKWGRNNFVLIRPGDTIRIPTAKKAEAAPQSKPAEQKPAEAKPPEVKPAATTEKQKEPSVMAGAFSIQPEGKRYNLLQPPGFEGQPGQSWTKDLDVKKAYDIDKRTTVFSKDSPNGDKHYMYSGRVDTGVFSGTDFRAAELIDNQGKIVARKIQYAEPVKMRINVPSSQNRELKVMAVESFFDRKTGTYTSRCLTQDGQVYRAQHSADGTVLWGQ